MKNFIFIVIIFCISCTKTSDKSKKEEEAKVFVPVIALHGGAGDLKGLNLTPADEQQYLMVMDSALQLGHQILMSGGTSLDAVESVIKILEDSPLFNAGRGAVFSHEGKNELDAAIMNGRNQDCAAVAGVTVVKNPIQLVRHIMDSSRFVFLSGAGAEQYAMDYKIPTVDPSYFFTQKRWDQFQEALKEDKEKLDHSPSGEKKMGTVGCVALDQFGNLAAGTSTGGITNKKYGRIGDSPVIGAGTYADNDGVAVSCTGRGEDFIKVAAAHEINSLVKYKKKSVEDAVERTLKEIVNKKGRGGCIALDRKGNYYLGFTTSGMFRGVIDSKGNKLLKIYE